MLYKAIRQSRLTVVDMGNNGKIADEVEVAHS